VEPEETSIIRQRLGKLVSAATDKQATLDFWKRYFLCSPSKEVIKKSSLENRQSNSRVPSEQLVESWALQGEAEKMAL
jgi:hypothetical protein